MQRNIAKARRRMDHVLAELSVREMREICKAGGIDRPRNRKEAIQALRGRPGLVRRALEAAAE